MPDELGPLAGLEGIWEGSQGRDVAPDDSRFDEEINLYRERVSFEPTGLVENHEQKLYGLRYAMTAWRIDAEDPFHEEVGYWLWDADAKQVTRCFIVPRGVALIAGGTAEPGATSFELVAEVGSSVYGICSNPFLDSEFRTVRYELRFERRGEDTFHYRQNTVLQIKGRKEPFEHTDENTLDRVK